MDRETPPALVGLAPDRGAVTCDDALIVGAPCLGTAGCHAAGAFRLDELDAAGIRETFFCRIDDLNHMAMSARGGELGNDVEQIRGMVAALNAAAAAP